MYTCRFNEKFGKDQNVHHNAFAYKLLILISRTGRSYKTFFSSALSQVVLTEKFFVSEEKVLQDRVVFVDFLTSQRVQIMFTKFLTCLTRPRNEVPWATTRIRFPDLNSGSTVSTQNGTVRCTRSLRDSWAGKFSLETSAKIGLLTVRTN